MEAHGSLRSNGNRGCHTEPRGFCGWPIRLARSVVNGGLTATHLIGVAAASARDDRLQLLVLALGADRSLPTRYPAVHSGLHCRGWLAIIVACDTRGGAMCPSRREFVKWMTANGIAASLSRLALAEEPEFAARETLPGRQAWNPAATGAGRIDGVAKVTGAKLYASDFRAADLPGWPQNTAHAMLILVPDATHVYTGMDLSRLSGALKPAVVVTAADLARIGTRVPEFYAGDLFCPVGTTPLYLGQPVALLIFEQFDAFDQARLALRDGTFVKFGEETGPVVGPNYGAFRFTRVAGPTPDAPDVYSPVKNGWVSPGRFQDSERPIWARLPIPTGRDYAEAATHGEQIRAELAATNPALLMLDREFETQSVDPVFLEPESGLAWYDAGAKNLELVLGVQSPYETAEALAYMLGNAGVPFKPAHIKTLFAYMGGGFGGRDHSPFPLYVALAAIFLPGRRRGWPMTAISSFKAASSVTPSRCARA